MNRSKTLIKRLELNFNWVCWFYSLSAKNTKSSINSLEDLSKQKKIKYGVLNGGSLYTFFSQSQVGTYQTMFHTMKTGNTFVNSIKEGVEKVRQGGFAFLTDGPYLDYYNSRNPCNTMMLENLLEAKSYGIALQRNSELTNPISVAILKVILNDCIHGHLIGEARYA